MRSFTWIVCVSLLCFSLFVSTCKADLAWNHCSESQGNDRMKVIEAKVYPTLPQAGDTMKLFVVGEVNECVTEGNWTAQLFYKGIYEKEFPMDVQNACDILANGCPFCEGVQRLTRYITLPDTCQKGEYTLNFNLKDQNSNPLVTCVSVHFTLI